MVLGVKFNTPHLPPVTLTESVQEVDVHDISSIIINSKQWNYSFNFTLAKGLHSLTVSCPPAAQKGTGPSRLHVVLTSQQRKHVSFTLSKKTKSYRKLGVGGKIRFELKCLKIDIYK